MKNVFISLISSILSFLCVFLLTKITALFVFAAPVFAIIALVSGIIGAVKMKNMPSKIVLVISLLTFLYSAGLIAFMYMISGI